MSSILQRSVLATFLLMSVSGCGGSSPQSPALPENVRTIFHVENVHFVDLKSFALDHLDQDPDLTAEELEVLYTDLIDQVIDYQLHQRTILEQLLQEHHIVVLYYEGLTLDPQEQNNYFEAVEMYWQLREQQLGKASGNSERDVMRSFPELALTVGNPGVLLKTGLLRSVEPTEDANLLAADNPMITGKFQVDHVAREARESFMIQQILKSNDQAMILVCGRGHEFQDNVPDGVKIVRIPVPYLSETISDSP